MSRYEPLGAFLKTQTRDQLPMSFAEIERVLKVRLPPSKLHRAWWSNNPSNNVMTKQWLDAGFETEGVDIPDEKLVFRRKKRGGATDKARAPRQRHQLFGCMKGLLTIEEGFDVTAPSDEEWGAELWIDEKP